MKFFIVWFWYLYENGWSLKFLHLFHCITIWLDFFFIWFLYIWILFSGLYFDSLKFVKIKFCQCISQRFTNTLSLFCVCKQSFTFVFVGFCIQRVEKKENCKLKSSTAQGRIMRLDSHCFITSCLFIEQRRTQNVYK